MLLFITAMFLGGFQGADPAEMTEPDRWQQSRVTIIMDYQGEEPVESISMPGVFTTRTDVIGAYLLCDADSYRVRLSQKPMYMRDSTKGEQRWTIRRVLFKLYIDGKQDFMGEADIWSQMDAVAPVGRMPAAKVFNAVVKGQDVAFSIRGQKKLSVHLPPVDDEFRAFASECKALQATDNKSDANLKDFDKRF